MPDQVMAGARRRIAVIGGGIVGVAAAWHLAAEHDVVVYEAELQLGVHATGRSAATLSETSGHRTVCALARASRDFLERPPAGFSDVPITSPRGLAWIGRAGDDRLLDELTAVAESGVAPTARRIDASEVARLGPPFRPEAIAAGALWEPDARGVDVAALLAAYASGITERGGVVRRDAALQAARRTTDRWALDIVGADGSTSTDRVDVVVDAAGAWGDVVATRCGVEPLGLRALRRTAALVPVPGDVASWPLVMDVANRCYFEPEAGGLLISPADEHESEPIDAQAEMEDVAWALEMLDETTTLAVRHVRSSWAGLRTFTPDRAPAIGWDGAVPGFLWCVGQGGAGIKTAPAGAALVADLVAGRPWPSSLTELGLHQPQLDPARFTQP